MKISSFASGFSALSTLLSLSFRALQANALGLTDTITWGGDNSRAGYQINHNMDPAIVGSAQFGQLFRTTLPGNYNGAKEQIFSQPLVYTSDTDGMQYVYVATTQNNIYKLDARTGVILASRNLHIPFLVSDLDGCVDINPLVGVIGTGVIDPTTDTWYLTSKTYADESATGAKGKPNARYYFHAINVNDFSERPGFPVNWENRPARNNPTRLFQAGIHLQRPALLHTGQYVYAGFASHCAQYNFTGWITGWDKTTGEIVEHYAMEGAGVPNDIDGGGVWMSGGGIASDDRGSIFFSTGNGKASQLATIPVLGRNPPTSLEEAAVHMTIGEGGRLTVVDFFMPWEKQQLDGADKDLGTSPLQLLPSQFSCGDVRRIGVITGKSGKTYWINLDDMGGYRNGASGLDDVLQVYQNENSVYAGAGVYPLEGGYIYVNVIRYPTHVFKFSCEGGVPSFTKVADSPTANAYILGVGHGTVTSLNDQPGTGLVWTSDVQGFQLRIYKAIPESGLMVQINQFNVPGVTKFSRPVFGDGRVYLGTNQGFFYGFGAPVNLPLNCTSPNFGVNDIGVPSAAQTVTCRALTGVQVVNITLSDAKDFIVSGLPTLPLNVANGGTFSFQAVFNASTVGTLSADVIIGTSNSVAGFSTNTPVALGGQGQSVDALLAITPGILTFEGVVTGEQPAGVNQSALFTNQGNSPLTITTIEYSLVGSNGPYVLPEGTPSAPKLGPFTFFNLPASIPGNTVQTVNVNFNPAATGAYSVYLKITSNGGTRFFSVAGSSGAPPIALIEFQSLDAMTWVPYSNSTPFTFGNVTQNTVKYLKMRITNNGPEFSSRLSLTISKAPFGGQTIINANNQVDLGEGVSLAPGESADATLSCAPPKRQVNSDPYTQTARWTLNLNDPAFGKRDIEFVCTAITQQFAPLAANGTGIYRYQGCYRGSAPGGKLKTRIGSSDEMTNGKCMADCFARPEKWAYASTEYHRECWCGDVAPPVKVAEENCNFDCEGNINEICGGNGVRGNSGSFFSLFVDTTRASGGGPGPGPVTPPGGPYVNPGVLGYVHQGCYTEATSGRALSVGKSISANATVYNCITACAGYTYAGVEYGQECYCGNTLAASSRLAPITDCGVVCRGNTTEYCGGGSRLNLYAIGLGTPSGTSSTVSSTSSPTAPTLPPPSSTSTTVSSSSSSTTAPPLTPSSSSTTVPSTSTTSSTAPPASTSGAWNLLGCYNEVPGRTLVGGFTASDAMTLELCQTYCGERGFPYAGVEYGRECFCGSNIRPPSTSGNTGCTFRCSGNSAQICGGSSRLNIYQRSPVSSSSSSTVPPTTTLTSTSTSTTATTAPPTSTPSGSWTALGCYNEVTGRTLQGGFLASDSMTVELCLTYCGDRGFPIAGVEYGRECFCGSTTRDATSGQSGCNIACAGNPAQICGGRSRLNVYKRTAGASSSTSSSPPIPSSSSTSSNTSSTTSSTSSTIEPGSPPSSSPSTSIPSTSTPVPSSTATPASPWIPLGCYNEIFGRSLNNAATASDNMTISLCQSFCSTPPNNYPLAGVEYGRECYCGNTIQPESTSGASGCTIPCAGDATEICGGGERLNVFNNTAWVAPALTQVFGVKLLGCYKEPEGGRAVVGFMYGDNALTVESCVAECSDRGYSIAGAEFGRECWCGNSLSVEAEKLGDEFCGMRCIGDESQLCGGVGYIVVYDGGSDAGPEPEPEPSTVMRAGSVRITAEDEMKAEGGLFSPLGGPLASGDAVEESGEPLDEEGEEEFVSPTGLDLGGEPLEPMETMTTVAPPVATPSVVGAVRWEE